MNNNILNEIKTIKKMMGLIVEQSNLKVDTGYGITPQNFNQFLEKAKINKDRPFLFGNYVFKLTYFGENNDKKEIGVFHRMQWSVERKLGYFTDKNAGGQNFPAFLTPLEAPTVRIDTTENRVAINPKESTGTFPIQSLDKQTSFNNFKTMLNQLSDKDEVIKIYGENIYAYGADVLEKL